MLRTTFRLSRWFLAFVLLCQVASASAEDIVVMTSGAFTAPYLELSEAFARKTADRFVTTATTMGVGRDAIPARLAVGEVADLVIVASDALADLEQRGLISSGSRVDLARSSIAMAVRKGAPHPAIRTVEELKRALLAAQSVAFSASVSGDYLVQELFPSLGIAEEMKLRGRRIEVERVGAVVARGDAEIGFQQLSELLPIPGIEVVGLLPPSVQRVTVFSAGLATSARHPDAARAFLAYLHSIEAQAVIERAGLDSLLVPANK